MLPSQSVIVTFDGVRQTTPVVSCEVREAFSVHGIAILDVTYGTFQQYTDVTTFAAPEWTTVTLDMTNGPDTARWYGYVHHSGAVTDIRGGDQPVLRYTLIGTSLPMNQQRYDSWSNYTRSGICREIGKRHNFRTVIQRTDGVVPYVGQTGTSDWSILTKLASDAGYRLYVSGSTVSFFDPTTYIQGVRAADIRGFKQDRISGVPDSLLKWKSAVGTMVPRTAGTNGTQTVSGLDTRTGTVVSSSASGAGRLTSIDTSQHVTGTTQVAAAAAANSANTSGWLTADAVVTGSPSLHPGMLVNITGRYVPTDQRGLWLVTGVKHRFVTLKSDDGGPFQSFLTLERDTFYAPNFSTAYRTINTRDSVPAVVRNGVYWESQILEDVSVG